MNDHDGTIGAFKDKDEYDCMICAGGFIGSILIERE